MKSEELSRYEEEFRAMREMLGTYCLELGLSPAEPDATPAPPDHPAPPPEDSGSPARQTPLGGDD